MIEYFGNISQLLPTFVAIAGGVGYLLERKKRRVEVTALQISNDQLKESVKKMSLENDESEIGVIDAKVELWEKMIDSISKRYDLEITKLKEHHASEIDRISERFVSEIDHLKSEVDHWKNLYKNVSK